MDLELISKEVPVGQYWLDILAKEKSDDANVAIENQLGWTDHIHLGQLLTYAAGQEVEYVIWVAANFTIEHRAAINWLNQLAPDKVCFYAVEIHTIKINDSPTAPDFRVVAAPSEWGSTRRFSSTRQNREIFQSLIEELESLGLTEDSNERVRSWGRFFSSGFANVVYVASIESYRNQHGAFITLRLNRDSEFNIHVENRLQEDKEQIEEELKAKLVWDRKSRLVDIYTYMEGSTNPPEKPDETRTWILETLLKFKEVFNPRLETILAELEDSEG